MAANKFILIENFQYLLNNLKGFVAPEFSNVHKGRPDLIGGPRRSHRGDKISINSSGKVNINFGSTSIECDKYIYSHITFKDAEMKETYPENQHIVMVTSRDSMANQTAQRYYVSCSCMDFDTTFLQQMVNSGYTKDPGSIPSSTGTKTTGVAICKHIYSIIAKYYQPILALEKGVAVIPADVMPWSSLIPPVIPPPTPTTTQAAPKKAEYAKLIAATLKRLSNSASDSIQAYKAPTDSPKHYRKYKFMVKWYGKGWAIVFTNPTLNPFPGGEYKEMVPIYTRTVNGLKPSPHSPIAVYGYFTKDELKDLIKNNSKEIQPAQVTRLKSILGIKATTPDSSWLTESLELAPSVMSTLREIL